MAPYWPNRTWFSELVLMASVPPWRISLRKDLLTALNSVKRLGDLQALSINKSWLEFGLAVSYVVLRPLLRYVPKVPATSFRD